MDLMLGQIFQFAGNYAPRGSMFCDGSILQIAQNQALYSLLGFTFGGDGKTTFALPDLRGRVPVGSGPSVDPAWQPTALVPGKATGTETVSLTMDQIPSHTHTIQVAKMAGTVTTPQNNLVGTVASNSVFIDQVPDTGTNPAWMSITSPPQGHPNMMPFLAINYCIATTGVYPMRP